MDRASPVTGRRRPAKPPGAARRTAVAKLYARFVAEALREGVETRRQAFTPATGGTGCEHRQWLANRDGDRVAPEGRRLGRMRAPALIDRLSSRFEDAAIKDRQPRRCFSSLLMSPATGYYLFTKRATAVLLLEGHHFSRRSKRLCLAKVYRCPWDACCSARSSR